MVSSASSGSKFLGLADDAPPCESLADVEAASKLFTNLSFCTHYAVENIKEIWSLTEADLTATPNHLQPMLPQGTLVLKSWLILNKEFMTIRNGFFGACSPRSGPTVTRVTSRSSCLADPHAFRFAHIDAERNELAAACVRATMACGKIDYAAMLCVLPGLWPFSNKFVPDMEDCVLDEKITAMPCVLKALVLTSSPTCDRSIFEELKRSLRRVDERVRHWLERRQPSREDLMVHSLIQMGGAGQAEWRLLDTELSIRANWFEEHKR